MNKNISLIEREKTKNKNTHKKNDLYHHTDFYAFDKMITLLINGFISLFTNIYIILGGKNDYHAL